MLIDEIRYYKKYGYLKFPKILQIEVTTKCPLKCPQCYKDLNHLHEMDFELLREIILFGKQNGLASVMINGGEPVLYSKFIELIELLNNNQIKGNCFTSGIGITQKFIDRIKELDIFLNISLNGSTNEINSFSRDGYKYAIEAIKLLNKNGFEYGINWVARHDNLYDFANIVKLAEEFNASNILVIGNKLNHHGVVDSPLTKHDLSYLVNFIIEYEKSQNEVPILRQQCFTSLCSEYNPNNTDQLNSGCLAGIKFCAIDVFGNYMPCTHLEYKEKFSDTLGYWNQSIILKQLRETKSKHLKECQGCQYISSCNFCRASYKETKDDFSIGPKKCLIYKKASF